MNSVTILGSSNIDLVITTNSLPKRGETILGNDLNYFYGGKGNNQAIACSRVGTNVNFISAVGNDSFGEKIINNIQRENIDISNVLKLKGVFTGLATVLKFATDNSIIVAPGANELIKSDSYVDFDKVISNSNIFLTQLEINFDTVKEGLRIAKNNGCLTILNPAPYIDKCIDLLDNVNIITPNETEFSSLCGTSINNESMLEQEMIKFSKKYQTILIVTRGNNGVSYVKEDTVITIPAFKVDVLDTTGAGDTFNGILAAYLANNYDLHEAIKYASIGASLSVTKIGAQTAMPSKYNLETAFKNN